MKLIYFVAISCLLPLICDGTRPRSKQSIDNAQDSVAHPRPEFLPQNRQNHQSDKKKNNFQKRNHLHSSAQNPLGDSYHPGDSSKPKHKHHHHQHRRRHEQNSSQNPTLVSLFRYQPNSSPFSNSFSSSQSQSSSPASSKSNKLSSSSEDAESSTDKAKSKGGRGKAFKFQSPQKKDRKKPNIIFMLTDDQDVEMNSMQYMPKTRKILIKEGVEARHAYVTTPMCCPSRSSILTGLYAHNHNVYTNGENCSSTTWQRTHERKTFATYLRDAGYRTAYFGKYLNEYNGSYIPPGWSDWSGLVKNSRYYNYTLNVNGDRIRHGDDYSSDYYPDLILNDTLQYMRYSRRFFSSKPYLIVMSFPSPHGTEDSAPQFQKQFFGERAHRTPSWNVAPNSDKQWILRHTGQMSPLQQHFTDFLNTKRLQTLQSVDDAVAKVYQELKDLGELDNTYIVYTSDNGYHLGQFGLVKGKAMPFEFDIRVPFFVRGPGLPAGSVLRDIVLNIDIAPTFMDIAGLKTPPHMDGTSFLPALKALANEDNSAALIRNTKEGKNARVVRDSFLIEKGKFKLQPRNMDQLLIPIVGKKQWLQLECQKPEYRSPCGPWQRFECYKDQENNYRIRKCRWKKKSRKQLCVCPQNLTEFASESNNIPKIGIQRRIRRDEESSQKDFFSDVFSSMFADETSTSGFDTMGVFELKRLVDLAKTRGQLPEVGNITAQQISSIIGRNSSISGSARVIKDKTFCTVERQNLTIECKTVNEFEDKDDSASETFNKNDLNAAIKALRRRLSELKEIRRIIKDKNRDGKDNGGPEVGSKQEELKFCDCSKPGAVTLPVTKDGLELRGLETGSGHRTHQPSKNHHQNPHHPRHFRPSGSAVINRKMLRQLNRKKWLKKQERKQKRKGKFENTTCQNSEQMNCFYHDSDHWKTPPLWNEEPFCFCQNSLNNSFWCMRTINASHNSLYCEFVTGFMLYFDMDEDPYQLRNAIYDLEFSTLEQLSNDLARLKDCAGSQDCSSTSGSILSSTTSGSINSSSTSNSRPRNTVKGFSQNNRNSNKNIPASNLTSGL